MARFLYSISIMMVLGACKASSSQVLLVGLYDQNYTADSGAYHAASVFAYELNRSPQVSSRDQAFRFLAQSSIGQNPSWIVSAGSATRGTELRRTSLFAVSESYNYSGTLQGTVASLDLQCDGTMRVTSRQKSGNGSPVFLSIDAEGRNVLCANYGAINVATGKVGEGSVGVLPVLHGDTAVSGPTLGPLSHVYSFGASSETHSAVFAPRGHANASTFALVPALGKDEVYEFRYSEGKLGKIGVHVSVPPGQGPRHIKFHRKLPIAVLVNEGTGPGPEPSSKTIVLYSFDSTNGKLAKIDSYSTLPPLMNSSEMYPAEILFSPCGRFVLVSNRDKTTAKRDGIAVFSISASDQLATSDPISGRTIKLRFQQYASVGWYPRSMALSEDGLLVVGNQKGSSISLLRMDLSSGWLTRVVPNDIPVAESIGSTPRSPAFVGYFDLPQHCTMDVLV